jgi:positive regulator of sigma E activity
MLILYGEVQLICCNTITEIILASVYEHTMRHSGTISKITNSTITVALEANINCESCKAKAACGVSESNDKEIEIDNPLAVPVHTNQTFQINEHVDVIMQEELGLKAVFWAYIFPFIFMISTLIIGSFYLSEWQAGLLSLAALLPYYISLRLLNSFFKKKFKVTLFKLT